jgi:phage tail-like protein
MNSVYDSKYPRLAPPAFFFEVMIDGFGSVQGAFQEASGMEVSAELETISEAGLNTFSHRVPKRTTYNNLVLKRGYVVEDSAMMDWVQQTLQDGISLGNKIVPKNILVTVLDPGYSTIPLRSWNFVNAYPVKWSLGALNSQESALTIESIEFAYSYWTFA